MNETIKYITINWVELVGTLLSLIYLVLSIKQKVSLWVFGFLSSAFYIYIFFESKFYADMTLQVYYLVISVFGWVSWKLGKQHTGHDLPVKRVKPLQALVLVLVGLLISVAYYLVLKNYTDSPVPIGDSLTTGFSIVATWMLARKIIEHWVLWVLVDGACIALFLYKELYFTSALFVVYTVMSVVGFFEWRKDLIVRK